MQSRPATLLPVRLLPWIALTVAVAAVGLLLADRLDHRAWKLSHFVQYWASARLLLRGGDPYALDQVHAVQGQAGWPAEKPLNFIMWNPPWTLTVVLPFGVLPFVAGRLLWNLMLLGVLLGCVNALWRWYGGEERLRSVAWVAAFTFFPTLMEMHAEQISPLLLLGVVGFVCLVEKKRDVAAGACAALLTIKPHLLLPFGTVLLLWAAHEQRCRVLVGGLLAGVVAVGVPLAFDPNVLGQYRQSLAHRDAVPDLDPTGTITPTLGAALRLAFGGEPAWLQFVPAVLASAWVAAHWFARRRTWEWRTELPLLVAVSVVAAPYAFVYDFVLLLAVVVPLAAWVCVHRERAVWAAAGHLGIGLVALGINLRGAPEYSYVWLPITVLLLYLALKAVPSRRMLLDRAVARV
jgi:hypothetical protein